MDRRTWFFVKNLLKGLLGLAVIIVLYNILQRYTNVDVFLDYLGNWPALVYIVFILSEVVFGIIPPELFMIWSLQNGLFSSYVLDVALLATISYIAGILGYYIGMHIVRFKWTAGFMNKNVLRYRNLLNRYGGFLIFVGAVTPVPFSAICMLVGSTNYSFRNFLLIALTRFLRFAVYGWVIWHAH